jgi:hypothetical protein
MSSSIAWMRATRGCQRSRAASLTQLMRGFGSRADAGGIGSPLPPARSLRNGEAIQLIDGFSPRAQCSTWRRSMSKRSGWMVSGILPETIMRRSIVENRCIHSAQCSVRLRQSPSTAVPGHWPLHIRKNRHPAQYGSDRGFFSEKNVTSCKQHGVKVVSIPQRGGTKTPEREAYEKSLEFKDGRRFRAGIEGRISVLFRGRGMKRCLAEGRERFELWVAAAVLANNLMKIAALLTDRSLCRRKAA